MMPEYWKPTFFTSSRCKFFADKAIRTGKEFAARVRSELDKDALVFVFGSTVRGMRICPVILMLLLWRILLKQCLA